MKPLQIIEPIDQVGFYDRRGKFRSTQGCSLRGLGEFRLWLDKLAELVNEYSAKFADKTYADLYIYSVEQKEGVSPVLATACDRLLELNGIKPDWVTPALLAQLLFNHIDPQGQPKAGLLIALNYPEKVAESTDEPVGDPIAQAIANLTKVTSGLEEALQIADNQPWKQVSGVLEAIAEQQKQEKAEAEGKPTKKSKAKKKLSPEQLRDKIAKMTAIPR